MTKRIINLFASVKLTVFLIFLVATLASLGTFLPQGEEAVGIAEKWGVGAYKLLLALGITDTYHSWWFLLAICLVAANLVACTIKRLPKVWRLHERTEESVLKDSDIPKSSFRESWISAANSTQALDIGRGVLAKRFGNLRNLEGGVGSAVWGEKHFLSLWGAYIVHLGLMFLFLGGVLGVVFGYSKYLVVKEGETLAVPKVQVQLKPRLDWWAVPGTSWQVLIPRLFERKDGQEDYQLKLNHFDVEFYPNSNAPKLYQSDVDIQRGGQSLQTASIRVNEPLEFGSVRFYQSSYGYEGANAVNLNIHLPHDEASYEVWMPYQKKFAIEKTGWSVEVTDFYPDATMAGPGKIVAKGGELNNPAIRVAFYKNGKLMTHYWTFFAFPEINASKIQGLGVEALKIDPIAYTVLQVNYDPGVPFALLGAIIILLGVFLSFYLFYQKAWLVVRPAPEGNGSQIELVGICKRNKLSFKKVFQELTQEMKAKLA